MTKILSVSNMPSGKTVQIRIYDLTAAATTVAWTSVGVSERVAVNKSTYYYTATLTAGHQYEISWQDNSTPIREAVEVLTASDPAQEADADHNRRLYRYRRSRESSSTLLILRARDGPLRR